MGRIDVREDAGLRGLVGRGRHALLGLLRLASPAAAADRAETRIRAYIVLVDIDLIGPGLDIQVARHLAGNAALRIDVRVLELQVAAHVDGRTAPRADR